MRSTPPVRDLLTPDLFDTPSIPQPAPLVPGGMNYAREIAHVMSQAIKVCDKDRYQIAADMSRLLGHEVTVDTLNTYTAESKEDRIPSLDRALAFDAVTGGFALLQFYAAKLGCQVLVGEEVLVAELGRVQQMKTVVREHEARLRQSLTAMRQRGGRK